MQNLTYLLGAGASANALPIYSNFKERFGLFFNLISGVKSDQFVENWHQAGIEALQNHTKSLLDELSFHTTPDVVAKKYFIQEKPELLRNLKATLVTYFFFEQTVTKLPRLRHDQPLWIEKPIVDNRYDGFISRLLSPEPGKFKLQKGINILTWNYDYQFELTCKFFSNKRIEDQNEIFISHPSIFEEMTLPMNRDSFKILHLNGVALASNLQPGNQRIGDLLGNKYGYEKYPIQVLAELYYYLIYDDSRLGTPLKNHMFFGWEKLDEYLQPKEDFYIFKESKKICEETEVLIIIGYSFPTFNQNVDTFLFENFTNLHTIYVQSNDFETVSSILANDFIPNIPKENRYKIKVIDVGYTNQFFIPRKEVKGDKEGEYSLI